MTIDQEARIKITQRRRARRDSQRRETQDPGKKSNLGHPNFSSSVLSVSSVVSMFPASALFCPPLATNSNYSRRSANFARKSNHSRTYAKQGGGGCFLQAACANNSFVFTNCMYYTSNYMSSYNVGAPTFSSSRTNARKGPLGSQTLPALQVHGTGCCFRNAPIAPFPFCHVCAYNLQLSPKHRPNSPAE